MANRRLSESRNPVFNDKVFERSVAGENAAVGQKHEIMTLKGAVNKTFVLFGFMVIAAVFGYTSPSQMLMYLGIFGGVGAAVFTGMKPHLSPFMAPITAALYGLAAGTFSYVYGAGSNGLILQAINLTMATLFMMLLIYKSGWIKVTDKFRTGMTMAIGAIMLVYVISWIGHFVGFTIPYLHEGGMIGIGISVVIVGVAAFSLLLDFDNFEKGVQYGAPKYMEWYVGMGLIITLVWLYIEILRLLSKLND